MGCTYGRGGETGSAATGVRTVPSGKDWPGKHSWGGLGQELAREILLRKAEEPVFA